MSFLSKYALLIKLGIALALIVGAFFFGQRTERSSIEAADARDARVAQVAYDATQRANADRVGQTEDKHHTIERKLETIIREVPIYRDCVNTPDSIQLLDDARANRATSVGDNPSPVPPVRADGSPDVR